MNGKDPAQNKSIKGLLQPEGLSLSPSSPPYSSSLPRRSVRIIERDQRRMNALQMQASQAGIPRSGHSSNNVTPHFFSPLTMGEDFRWYTSRAARSAIRQQIERSTNTYSSLEQTGIPGSLLTLRNNSLVDHGFLSNRHDRDYFQSGEDLSFTNFSNIDVSGTRTAQDTPRPRSPHPEETGSALQVEHGRYENAHLDPFSFTGMPGHTVHAPTQGNQAVDTVHESHAAKPGGILFRRATYGGLSNWSVLPVGNGEFEVMHSYYARRAQTNPEISQFSEVTPLEHSSELNLHIGNQSTNRPVLRSSSAPNPFGTTHTASSSHLSLPHSPWGHSVQPGLPFGNQSTNRPVLGSSSAPNPFGTTHTASSSHLSLPHPPWGHPVQPGLTFGNQSTNRPVLGSSSAPNPFGTTHTASSSHLSLPHHPVQPGLPSGNQGVNRDSIKK
ncbi:hypothetical protein OAP18_01335 [Gammaproteobacteria bacterium]|nr:hypothetical protein [Gammaproteobacteria bacterium]